MKLNHLLKMSILDSSNLESYHHSNIVTAKQISLAVAAVNKHCYFNNIAISEQK